jgi:hypothetical protein
MTASEPVDDLSGLRRALTAPGTPEELRAEAAVLAAYRGVTSRPGHGRTGLRLVSGLGMTAAASSLVLSMTAVTAAAYTANLPHAVQHAAHRLFHRIGVPAPERSHHAAPADLAAPQESAEPAHAGTRQATSTSGLPAEARRDGPLIRPARTLLRVGDPDRIGLTLGAAASRDRRPARVTLLARTPGALSWSAVAQTSLDSRGTATVTLSRVEHNLELRWSVARPQLRPLLSSIALVRAQPSLALSPTRASAARGSTVTLSALTAPAQHGRVLTLQELAAGRWRDVGSAVVDHLGHASIPLDTRQPGRHVYRGLLPSDRLFAAVTATASVEVTS